MIEIVTLLAPVFAQIAPAPPVPPPPPPPSDALPEAQRSRFVSFVARPVTCGVSTVTPTAIEQPMPSTDYAFRPVDIGRGAISLTFTIDATGRPIDIASSSRDLPDEIDVSDVMPAFATWRFAPGTSRRGCRVAFAIDDRPVTAASPAAAMRYLALQGGDRPIFERTIPSGSTCFTPNAPPELVRVWPDFETIPQRPGTRKLHHDRVRSQPQRKAGERPHHRFGRESRSRYEECRVGPALTLRQGRSCRVYLPVSPHAERADAGAGWPQSSRIPRR